MKSLAPLIEVRPARIGDADGIARVHSESWRATYRDILPAWYLNGLTPTRLASRWRENLPGEAQALVAEHNGRIIGFATGGRPRAPGALTAELFMLYLLPAYQGRGAGRGLLAAMMARFCAEGQTAMRLWVVASNYPARGFYHAMGGRPFDERTEPFAGIPVPEIAYRWTDLRRSQKFLIRNK